MIVKLIVTLELRLCCVGGSPAGVSWTSRYKTLLVRVFGSCLSVCDCSRVYLSTYYWRIRNSNGETWSRHSKNPSESFVTWTRIRCSSTYWCTHFPFFSKLLPLHYCTLDYSKDAVTVVDAVNCYKMATECRLADAYRQNAQRLQRSIIGSRTNEEWLG